MLDGTGDGLVTRVINWARHPFESDMDAMHWAMFLGLVIIIVFMWTRVMSYIQEV